MNNVSQWYGEWVLGCIKTDSQTNIDETIDDIIQIIEKWEKIPMDQMMHFALVGYNNNPEEVSKILNAVDARFNNPNQIIDFENLPAGVGAAVLKRNCKVLNFSYLDDGKLVELP